MNTVALAFCPLFAPFATLDFTAASANHVPTEPTLLLLILPPTVHEELYLRLEGQQALKSQRSPTL